MSAVKGSNHSNVRKCVASQPKRHGDQSYSRVTIDAFPDNVLLDIFDFYLAEVRGRVTMGKAMKPSVEDAWHPLVHVCQRWRHIVFASPRRLCLELLCTNTNRRSMRQDPNIWPALPIVIHCDAVPQDWDVTHIPAALKRPNLVRRIHIEDNRLFLLQEPFAAMKDPFPALTDLTLLSRSRNPPILTDSFLGGSAPRLQNLDLWNISFPGLGRLLLSTSHLVKLSLWHIYKSGYISPDAMVTSLSTLTRLKELVINFIEPRFPQYPPSPRTVVLPALTNFKFRGEKGYLEDFLSIIDAPSLEDISLTFNTYPSSGTPLLRLFLSHTEAFKTSHRVDILFDKSRADVTLFRQTRESDHKPQEFRISCQTWWEQSLTPLPRLCCSFLSPLLTVEHLCIVDYGYHPKEDYTSPPWLELLAPFISVRDLDISYSVHIVELTGERTTEVLPALQNIILGHRHGPSREHVPKSLARFIDARQLSGQPVTIDFQER